MAWLVPLKHARNLSVLLLTTKPLSRTSCTGLHCSRIRSWRTDGRASSSVPEPLLARLRSLMELRRCTIDLIGDPKLQHHCSQSCCTPDQVLDAWSMAHRAMWTMRHLLYSSCVPALSALFEMHPAFLWIACGASTLSRTCIDNQKAETRGLYGSESGGRLCAHLCMETSTTTSGHRADIVSRSRSVASFPSSRARTADRMVVHEGCREEGTVCCVADHCTMTREHRARDHLSRSSLSSSVHRSRGNSS